MPHKSIAVMLLVPSSLSGVLSSFVLQQLFGDLFVFFVLSYLQLSLLTIPLSCSNVNMTINMSELLEINSAQTTVSQS